MTKKLALKIASIFLSLAGATIGVIISDIECKETEDRIMNEVMVKVGDVMANSAKEGNI